MKHDVRPHKAAQTNTDRITLNRRETARVLGMSEAATDDAIRRGDIPSLRIGKRVLIPLAGLQRLVNKRR